MNTTKPKIQLLKSDDNYSLDPHTDGSWADHQPIPLKIPPPCFRFGNNKGGGVLFSRMEKIHEKLTKTLQNNPKKNSVAFGGRKGINKGVGVFSRKSVDHHAGHSKCIQ